MYAFEELLLRYWGYRDELGGVGHAGGILRGAENGDTVVRCAECLYAFIGLLTVIEGGGHPVEAKKGVCDEGWGRPFSGLH